MPKTETEYMPIENIIDIWERANIPNGRNVLLALGFDETNINVMQLTKVLEDEIRLQLEEEEQREQTSTRIVFIRSLLALQATELTNLRLSCRQLKEENDKLRADNKEANNRIALLAIEIDERHATLEDTSKKELHALEQRHANIMRELTVRMSSDREQWTQLTNKLEMRIKHFEEKDVKLSTELELLRNENNDLELEQQKSRLQLAELNEQNALLNKKIVDMQMSLNKYQTKQQQVEEEEPQKQPHDIKNFHEHTEHVNDNDPSNNNEMIQKLATLQMENTKLRDKNDELVTEMENLNLDMQRLKVNFNKKNNNNNNTTTINEVTSSEVPFTQYSVEADVTEEVKEQALNSELKQSTGSLSILQKRILELEEQLFNTTIKSEKSLEEGEEHEMASGTNITLEVRCKELETSLEQMQHAYEDCEDYWQGKLNEERQLFNKERQIYEEEQLENDKKFTQLMEKVREYEEQFSKEARLSPIPEKDILEQQYLDLEREAEELRAHANQIFAVKSHEIELLQQEIADLRLRLGESVEILTGATEMHTEAKQAAANNKHDSPTSSPISYLWQQSTIQAPAKHIEEQFSNIINNNINSNNSNNKQLPQR